MAARKETKAPRCIVIAGPTGAGKTTLAREVLVKSAASIRFVNADLIAAGLSPLHPESAAIQAGKPLLTEIDRLAEAGLDFAFETTLSGSAHASRLTRLRAQGYQIIIIFIKSNSARLAKQRVVSRVRQGGHNVPAKDFERRFDRGLKNVQEIYRPLADSWVICNNSGEHTRLEESGP